MTWIRINTSSSKQIPNSTIGKLLKQTTNYYFIQHWHLNKTIQELKSNCEIYDDILGTIVSYSDYKRSIPCMRFKVIEYVEDIDSGSKTYGQFTGVRVKLEPVNKQRAFERGLEQNVIAEVSALNDCDE